jgi:YggT family protein
VAALELGPLADAVDTAVSFVTALYWIYLILIFAYIILSWIRLPYSTWSTRIQRFLYDTVNPYLSLFRRFLPMLRLGGMGLDLSPIVGLIVLSAAWRLIVYGIEHLR